jgi:glyoxylate reductase
MSSTKKTVAVTRLIPEAGLKILAQHFEIRQHRSNIPVNSEELHQLLNGVDGVMTMLSDKIDGALLDKFPQVKVVANFAVGHENINHQEAAERGVWVTNTPDVLTAATADIAMALILGITRRLVESDQFMRNGLYKQWEPNLLLGSGLDGKTLGVVGYGRIGRAVADRARAFGMKIVFSDPTMDGNVGEDAAVEFDYLIENADIVSLHCPYKAEMHHLINADVLKKMKPNSYFINTARGGLMDEKALYQALKNKEIAGAGLDVYENEPEFVEGLASLNNVVMVPHIGSATQETRDAMAELAANNIVEILLGRPPITPVNKPKGFSE